MPTPKPGVVLATAAMAVFLVFLDTTALFVAYPDLRADFADVSPSQLSWVLNSYTLTVAALLIPAGRLADRVGRKRVFLVATALFCVGSTLCGLAPSVELLIVARVLQAVGAAGLIPSSLGLVLVAYPRERVPVAVAVWGAVGAVAGAVGPTAGAALVEAWGWRSVFFLNIPFVVGVLVAGPRLLPESKEATTGRLPDPLSVALLAGGLAAVAFGVVQTDEWGWTSAGSLGAMAGGALAVAVFLWRSSRVANPLFPLELFRINGVRWGNLGMFTFAAVFTMAFFGNVQFLTGVWDWSVLKAGFAIAPGPLSVAVLAPLAGRIAARRGQRLLLVPGGLVYGAGALWMLTHAEVRPDYLGTFLPANLLTGLGVALCLPQLSSVAVQQLPPDRSATGSGISQSIRQMGATIGVAVFVALLGTPGPGEAIDRFQRVWWFVIAGGVAVSLSALALRRPAPAAASPPAGAAADLPVAVEVTA
ncbi:MAG TPA: DHA2 family efflux MFS transporter permease subunit [Acidimicrobiales bacterium]|nr:DHA2 family efflux MFS transporter permease subunit [Acidimicrobiales bacterium]